MTVKSESAHPAPRRRRSLATEQRLAAAAIALIDEGGLAACTASALAARAGVAVGTIYARFADKDALIAAALLNLASLDGGAHDAAFSAWADDASDLAGFLERVARAAVETCRDHRTFLISVREFSRKHADVAWRKRFRGEQGRARAVILEAAVRRFGAEVRGGAFGLRMALAAIHGAIEATWLEPTGGPFDEPPDAETFIAALVDMQLRFLTQADRPLTPPTHSAQP